jgi:hypothetical protein
MSGDDRARLSGSPDGIRANGGTGGWMFSPREDRFVNRSRNL